MQSELALGVSDPEIAADVKEFYRLLAIPADAAARAISMEPFGGR